MARCFSKLIGEDQMTVSKTEDGKQLFCRDNLKFAFAATDEFIGTILQ